MLAEINVFTTLLEQQGPYAALEYLNSRTPHRYTGLFRFDGDTPHQVILFDRNQAGLQHLQDVPADLTYCLLATRNQPFLEIADAGAIPWAQPSATPIISYCGMLVPDAQGQPYGVLCHYDKQRCQERTTDTPLLAAAAVLLYQFLHHPAAIGA